MLGDFEKEPSSVSNAPSSDTNEMESQGFEASGPSGFGQCFSFHHREDVISHRIEAPPGRIGKEAFRGQYPSGQIILQDIMNLFHHSTSFPLPPKQSLPIPTPYVGDHGKMVVRVSVPKEFSLQRSNADGQVSIRFQSAGCQRTGDIQGVTLQEIEMLQMLL